MKKALILNYHVLDSPNRKEISGLEKLYLVPYTSFRAQMQLLKDENIPLTSLEDQVNGNTTGDYSLALTFDDGNSSDLPDAAPVLKELGIPATFFISLHNIERGHISWQDIKELIRQGFSIGSHGLSHRDLTTLSPEKIKQELSWSKQTLEEKTGKIVPFFSLPFGMYSDRILYAAAEAGYRSVFSSGLRLNPVSDTPFLQYRWAVKPTTPLDEFARIVGNEESYIFRKVLLSKSRKTMMNVMGSRLTNKLNMWFHSVKDIK